MRYSAILTRKIKKSAYATSLAISFMDSAGKFYHGFLLGLLNGLRGYQKKSNLESGDGRYDIILMPHDERQPAVILELKWAKKYTEMEKLCKEALLQIGERHYDGVLVEKGYPLILKYGICFCGKSCMVRIGNTENKTEAARS